MKHQTRNYGIDLLRILSMMMVVTLHVLGKGNLLFNDSLKVGTSTYDILWIAEIGSYCAVNCYALISGYVGVSARFKYSNIIILWLQVAFYSIGIYLLFVLLDYTSFSYHDLIFYSLPVLNDAYWYFTAYFCLFFFIPVLNAGLTKLTTRQITTMIICLTIALSFLPTFNKTDLFKTSGGYSVIWLIFLYLLGGALKRWNIQSILSKYGGLLLYIAAVAITFMNKYSTDMLHLSSDAHTINLVEYYSPTIVCAALGLVLFCSQLKLAYLYHVVKLLAPLCFSIYLIHEHELIKTRYIVDQFSYMLTLPPTSLVLELVKTVCLICLITMGIDIVRHLLFKLLHIKAALNHLERCLQRTSQDIQKTSDTQAT